MPNIVQPPPTAVLTDKPANPIWTNWFNNIFFFLKRAPTIYTGILPPTITPIKVGDTFVDTFAKKIYVSVDTASSADWEILN